MAKEGKNEVYKKHTYIKMGLSIGLVLIILLNVYNFYMDHQNFPCSQFDAVKDCPFAMKSIENATANGINVTMNLDQTIICPRQCTYSESFSHVKMSYVQKPLNTVPTLALLLLIPLLIGYVTDIYRKNRISKN